MDRCDCCGSAFGGRICYFCDKSCCTSCMADDRSRCRDCYASKRRLGWKKLVQKNKMILAFIACLWLYAVFPGPFLPGLDPGFYAITVVAAILIMAPVCLMLFFWSMNPPTSDARKKRK